jgi:hypothetical protein
MALPETALGSVPPSEEGTLEQPTGASGTRLKVAARPATVGATWMDLFHPGTPSPPSLEARVRVVADIAGALIQIHDNAGLPRAHRRHGRLTPRHLLIGVDGSASLFNAREPFSKLLPPQPDLGYLAPELLTQSGPATQQSDVFSLGVLLWEALDNGRLFPHRRAAAISRLIARRSLPGARIEDEWALPLGEVAMKALSQNPEDRYLDGTAFWLALREHLPPPDAARQALSRLAQRALKLELTTDIRDEPPYLAPRVIGLGASVPPIRSSFDEEPELEAPARYSLHPERSSRHGIPSQPPLDATAWGLSEPPPRSSLFGADPGALALATPASRSRPPSARTTASEPPASQRPSAPSVTPRARYSQPPARTETDSPISTLHVNLPRELLDASLPFYVSSQPASRAFPWGALSFAALIFFGVGAAVAFGAVTALRTPSNAQTEGTRAAAPIAAPSPPSSAPPPVAATPEAPPPTPTPSPVVQEAVVTNPAPVAATTATPPTGALASPTDPSVAAPVAESAPAAKAADPRRAHARRAKPSKPKRPKPLSAPAAAPIVEEATVVVPPPEPEPEPSPEIIREVPDDETPPAPNAPSAESDDETQTPPADLPFVDQPY